MNQNVLSVAMCFAAAASAGCAHGPPCTGDASAAFNADVALTLAAKSYRVHTVRTSFGTKVFDIEYVAPDRVRISGDSPAEREIIYIGNKAWTRKNGPWHSTSNDFGSVRALTRFAGDLKERLGQTHTTIGSLGNGTWNGQPAYLYCVSSAVAGLRSDATMYALADHRIHHIVITSLLGSQTIDYSDFNAPISIRAPI